MSRNDSSNGHGVQRRPSDPFEPRRVEPRIRTAQEVVSRKWHPLIVYYLIKDGPLSFSDLEERLHGVSSKVLTDSLADLADKDVVRRSVRETRPLRVEYAATEHGATLRPVIAAMIEWGRDARSGDRD